MPFPDSPSHTAAFLLGRDDGREHERAATVAHLRLQEKACAGDTEAEAYYGAAADEIEAGEHVPAATMTEETPAGPVPVDGGNVVQLVTAPVTEQGKRTDRTSSPGGLKSVAPGSAIRTQAILRAPSDVQSLFRAGVISEKDAAKLGPKGEQTPEQAATIREAVNAANAVVAAHPPAVTPKDKRKVKVAVGVAVKSTLARPAPAQPKVSALVEQHTREFLGWLSALRPHEIAYVKAAVKGA